MSEPYYSVPEAIEALGYDAACPPYLVHRACILLEQGGVGTKSECRMAREFASALDVPCARLSLRVPVEAFDGWRER